MSVFTYAVLFYWFLRVVSADDELEKTALQLGLQYGGMAMSALGMVSIAVGTGIWVYRAVKERRNKDDNADNDLKTKSVWATPVDSVNKKKKKDKDKKKKPPQTKLNNQKPENKNINKDAAPKKTDKALIKPDNKKPADAPPPAVLVPVAAKPSTPPAPKPNPVPPVDHRPFRKPATPPPRKVEPLREQPKVDEDCSVNMHKPKAEVVIMNEMLDFDADAKVDTGLRGGWNPGKARQQKNFVTNNGLDINADAKVDTGLHSKVIRRDPRKVEVNHGQTEINANSKIDTGLRRKRKPAPKPQDEAGLAPVDMALVSV